jgi:hypothetical protein
MVCLREARRVPEFNIIGILGPMSLVKARLGNLWVTGGLSAESG